MLVETDLPNLFNRGKVRDTYDLGSGLLLMVATDRISAYDVVLPDGIPLKGMVLARMSAFWFKTTSHIVPNHYLGMADDEGVREKYPNVPTLADLQPEIARRSMIIRKAQRIDVECIVRGYLAGSAWSEYKRQGTVWGAEATPGPQGGGGLARTHVYSNHQGRGGP